MHAAAQASSHLPVSALAGKKWIELLPHLQAHCPDFNLGAYVLLLVCVDLILVACSP